MLPLNRLKDELEPTKIPRRALTERGTDSVRTPVQCRRYATDLGLNIFALFAIFAVQFFQAFALGPPEIKVDHFERSLQPGELVLLRVHPSVPVDQVEGKGIGRTVRFYRDTNRSFWNGMLGIDLETKPGEYVVQITALSSGRPVGAKVSLDVKGKDFPTRRLTVKEGFVTPPPEELARIQREQQTVSRIFAAISPERFWSDSFILPVAGTVVSGFGARSILNGQPRRPHGGADFRAAEGTPIKAPNSGKVVLAENLYYSGNTVILDHGLGVYSYMAHLSRFAVRQGESVKAGDIVGFVGKTGRATGPHLHWAVHVNRARIDPLSLVAITERIEN